MFEKITKTLSGLAFIKYINSLIDYVNTSDIDATRIKGQLDISNIPPAGLDNVIKVDTVTDMLALTVDDVQNGDTVMIIGVTPPVQYQVVDDTKLGTMDAFQEYAAGTATKALADINGNNIHTTYGKLAGNNTWTGTNTYNRDIYVTNGSSAGSSGTLYLGVKPTNETVQARIGTDKLGGLFYHASTNQPHVFRVGTNNDVLSIRDDTSKMTLISNNKAFATVTYDGVAKWLGDANTATKLQTARTINGVAFDGTANITIADSTKLPIAGGTMTGDLTLKGNPTADLMAATKKYVDDSVASATADLRSSNNMWTGTNTFQNLVTMVGGVVFTSGTTTLAWKNATQIVATINASTYTGNSATATKLATARTITANLASSTAGSFDGSANITVGVTGTLPIANGGTGLTSAPSMLVNLASTTATSPLQASPRPGVTGTLPIANGGTGQTTAAGVRNALGLGNTTGAVPIANGGTGATTAAAARTALGCAPAYTYSTTDLTAGSSALTTGTLYIVYE